MKGHTPLVVGNWKMNPDTSRSARRILSGVLDSLGSSRGVDVVVCPPFVFLPMAKEIIGRSKKVSLGAQDVFWKPNGSYTGEVSPKQLSEFGVKKVIVGHSERRALGESDELIAKKVAHGLETDMDVVLCVGEKERDDNGNYLSVLESQIKNSLTGVSGKYLGQLTVAYEPIWAIGADRAMGSNEIHEMVIFIRRTLSRMYNKRYSDQPRIIYGGSVNAENIEDIMKNGQVNGVLPGRASQDPDVFSEIVKVAGRFK